MSKSKAKQPRNAVGRPTKLNAETTRKICDAILVGATYEAAAQYAGVSYDAFNEWMRRDEPKYRQFRQSVETANASAQVYFATNIKTAASGGDWRAAAWMLERRFKQDYAAKQEIEHSGNVELFNHEVITKLLASRPGGDREASGSD